MSTEELSMALRSYAECCPKGFTQDDACQALGWEREEFMDAVHRLRLELADEPLNLPCVPNGKQKWVYFLTGDLETCRVWAVNRVGDAETRVITMAAIMHSAVKATDARTGPGKKARLMDKALTRLAEDLDDLDAEGVFNHA